MKPHFLLLPVLAVAGILMLAMGTPAATAATGHPANHSARGVATFGERMASARHAPLPLCEAAKGCRVVPGSPAARGDTAQAVPAATTEGPYNIGAYNSNYYLDAEHQDVPTRAWVYPHNGGGAQIWYDSCCYTMSGSYGIEVTGGVLFATYKGYDMCLNVSGYSWKAKTPLLAWPCGGGGHTVSENELFYFPNVGTGTSYYEMCPVDAAAENSNLCANVSDGIGSQHYLILWNASGTPENMQFRFYTAFR